MGPTAASELLASDMVAFSLSQSPSLPILLSEPGSLAQKEKSLGVKVLAITAGGVFAPTRLLSKKCRSRPGCRQQIPSTVGTKIIADLEKCFQELVSGKLLILLRDRPCLELLLISSKAFLVQDQLTGIGLNAINSRSANNSSKKVFKITGPALSRINSGIPLSSK